MHEPDAAGMPYGEAVVLNKTTKCICMSPGMVQMHLQSPCTPSNAFTGRRARLERISDPGSYPRCHRVGARFVTARARFHRSHENGTPRCVSVKICNYVLSSCRALAAALPTGCVFIDPSNGLLSAYQQNTSGTVLQTTFIK